MSTFDIDDDVRQIESDELHGQHDWRDDYRDLTPPHGIERPQAARVVES